MPLLYSLQVLPPRSTPREREREEQERARKSKTKTHTLDRAKKASCLRVCLQLHDTLRVFSIRVCKNNILHITMATPFQDFLRDREYTGRPLVVSNQFPPPEGTDFVEVVEAKKEPGMGTVHRGRLLMQNDQVRTPVFSTRFVRTRTYVRQCPRTRIYEVSFRESIRSYSIFSAKKKCSPRL